ncbi:MAG: hypothetical protein WDO15_24730 [Bacteroidota bacterium]
MIDSVGDGGVHLFKCTGVDHDFVHAFSIKILAGDQFFDGMTNNYGNPDDFIRRVMVNQTAVRTWGFKKNEDAIGRIVAAANGRRFYIQAVMADFNWSSAHKVIDPVMLWYTPGNRFMTIKLKADANFNETLSQVKTIYDNMFTRDVFYYEFADDVYNRQYGEDEKFSKLFGIFSGLAALIASMGLFDSLPSQPNDAVRRSGNTQGDGRNGEEHRWIARQRIRCAGVYCLCDCKSRSVVCDVAMAGDVRLSTCH